MRVISATNERVHTREGFLTGSAPTAVRAANIELLGLVFCSAVVALGLWLTMWGRLAQLDEDDSTVRSVVDLRTLHDPSKLAALLTMFESPAERQASATLLFRRAVGDAPVLDHVGGLADVTIPAADVRANTRLRQLRARLERRPVATRVPILTPADIASLKPGLVVRSRADFADAIRRAALWFFAAFAMAHLLRRWRGAQDDPLVLPVLLMLSGIGLISMIALRDPLRDTLTASAFAKGIAGGLVLLLAASEVDFEASPLRRAVIAPLGLALGLAALLLVLGTGPGTSGVKVNLFGVQPVEAIRLLVVSALAAYFARRLDFLRELSEAPTATPSWLRGVRVPRWKDVRPVVVSMALVLAFFFLQKDLGPALVLSCVVMALYAIARGRVAFVFAGFGLLFLGFAAAYLIGHPSTVGQRVSIWLNPWNNGVAGGNREVAGGVLGAPRQDRSGAAAPDSAVRNRFLPATRTSCWPQSVRNSDSSVSR